MPATRVSKGQVLAVVDSPDLDREAVAGGGDPGEPARSTGSARRSMPSTSSRSCTMPTIRREVDQKTAQRERDRSRKAYELGSYSELQALRAEDALEKAQFAFEQAKSNYESQPKQNRFDIDSKKALFDRQQFLVSDLQAPGRWPERQVAGGWSGRPGAGSRSRQRRQGRAVAHGGRSVGARSGDQGNREPGARSCAPA